MNRTFKHKQASRAKRSVRARLRAQRSDAHPMASLLRAGQYKTAPILGRADEAQNTLRDFACCPTKAKYASIAARAG